MASRSCENSMIFEHTLHIQADTCKAGPEMRTARIGVPVHDNLHAMQFRPPPPSQVRDVRQSNGLLELIVSVRWIPLMTAAYGTRVARPARTTTLAPWGEAHPG
jgi:hypothetical protein